MWQVSPNVLHFTNQESGARQFNPNAQAPWPGGEEGLSVQSPHPVWGQRGRKSGVRTGWWAAPHRALLGTGKWKEAQSELALRQRG